MAEILFTHSFFLHFDPKQERAMMPYPPLGTLYAAGYLESKQFSVGLFDSMLADSEEDLRIALLYHKPKVFAIYDDDFNYLNKMCLTRMREAAFSMIDIAKDSGLFVVVHGSDAADHYEKYLQRGADVVLRGESELTLLRVCEQVLRQNNLQFEGVPGVAIKKNGSIVCNGKPPINKALDELPFPAWHLIDHANYKREWLRRHGYFSMNMVTTRGCPYHCNWCAKPIYGQVYNARSPENVVEEILSLRNSFHPDHFWFADDIFGLKPGWVQEFSSLIRQKGIKIKFKIQSRADLLLQGDTIEALASAGCEEVWIGAESGSQKVLDAMEKGITVQQIYEARKRLGKNNIKTSFFLQFGYPGETAEDVESTIRMVKDLLPDDIGISVSYPLPGTKFYERVKSELKGKQNWIDSDDLAMMYRSTYSPAYYKRLHRYVHKIFRIRQGFKFLARLLRFDAALTGNYMRRIATLGWYLPAIIFDRIQLARLTKN